MGAKFFRRAGGRVPESTGHKKTRKPLLPRQDIITVSVFQSKSFIYYS